MVKVTVLRYLVRFQKTINSLRPIGRFENKFQKNEKG